MFVNIFNVEMASQQEIPYEDEVIPQAEDPAVQDGGQSSAAEDNATSQPSTDSDPSNDDFSDEVAKMERTIANMKA